MLRFATLATLALLPLTALAQDAEAPESEAPATENTTTEPDDSAAKRAVRTGAATEEPDDDDSDAEESDDAPKTAVRTASAKEPEPESTERTAKASEEAREPEPEPEPEPKPKEEVKTTFKASGLYTMWGLTQQNFLFGKTVADGSEHPLDDTQYIVQMLRVQAEATHGNIGAVARLDAGQGWWGVNNDYNHQDVTVVDIDGDGNVTTSEINAYNESAMFANKDTNYTVHFDHVYGWGLVEMGETDVKLSVGRMYYGVGHKLVLDQDLDGMQLAIMPSKTTNITLMYAKMSEGRGTFKDPKGLLMSDVDIKGDAPVAGYGDADLFGLSAKFGNKTTDHHGEIFALYYMDRSGLEKCSDATDCWSYLPSGLGYFRSRYTPNISQLAAFGLAADGKLADAGITYKAEGDFLIGKDNVDNQDHAGGLLDINDGNIMGYNAYVDVKKSIDAAEGMDAGVIFGFGSGDADKTKGAGNVNKIQTMGFFPFTNVWEDSVMPDVEGISPQGLGSPVSRGYREFENTIAAQLNYGIKPVKPLRLEASYTYLTATTPIQGWDDTGAPTGKGATDLGMEVDANAIVTFNNGMQFKTLGGVFLPGEAGALLINGNTDAMDAAWEIKNVFIVKF